MRARNLVLTLVFTLASVVSISAASSRVFITPGPFYIFGKCKDCQASPIRSSVLAFDTPLDWLRSKLVPQLSDEKQRVLGRRLDDHIISYLRKMVRICRYKRHRELRWYYEEAWEFATNKIYGELPPRPDYNLRGTGIIPPPEPKPLTGYQIQMRQRPMRKVVSAMANDGELYLVLECQHHLREFIFDPDAPKPQRRRCAQCAEELAKKQPSSAKLNSKAVSA